MHVFYEGRRGGRLSSSSFKKRERSESVSPSVLSHTLFATSWTSPPGSSVDGILQATKMEWGAIPFSRGSFQPRDQTQVSCIAGSFFTIRATREASADDKRVGRGDVFLLTS